ncbi:MAG: hypothetical protein HC911_15900 [Chloroflexaceae bacterium]|nr:hypothetical protein [Chloroflexaceae bacterium]
MLMQPSKPSSPQAQRMAQLAACLLAALEKRNGQPTGNAPIVARGRDQRGNGT